MTKRPSWSQPGILFLSVVMTSLVYWAWISPAMVANAPTADFYIPATISPTAQSTLHTFSQQQRNGTVVPAADDLPGWRTFQQTVENTVQSANEAIVSKYEATVEATTLGNVPVLEILPPGYEDTGQVLVYLHGGGYTLFSARSSLIYSVPLAAATGLKTIAVDYTLAPFAHYDQITGEVVSVLQALQAQGYAPQDIAILGASAGGALAAGSVLRLRDQGLGLPAVLVLWSPWADITETGDTYQTLKDADPNFLYENVLKASAEAYAPPEAQTHPYVSPVYGDFRPGFPPTLIQGGTKEIFLSNFVRLYQALDQAHQPVKLDLYEGMWHVFQVFRDLPEAHLAWQKSVDFLQAHL